MDIYTPKLPIYWDNVAIHSTYGVYASGTKGLEDLPKLKDVLKYSWPDLPGESVDLASPQLEPKEFTIDFWIKGTSLLDCEQKLNTFMRALIAPVTNVGTHRLHIAIDANTPLIYQVYCPDGVATNLRKKPDQQMVSFSVKFREPEPVKKIYKWVAPPNLCTITISATKPVNIYWGDGTISADITPDITNTVNHTYSNGAGTKWIVITGDMESITYLSTTAVLVWDKLI